VPQKNPLAGNLGRWINWVIGYALEQVSPATELTFTLGDYQASTGGFLSLRVWLPGLGIASLAIIRQGKDAPNSEVFNERCHSLVPWEIG
jgi:hypothetical protein